MIPSSDLNYHRRSEFIPTRAPEQAVFPVGINSDLRPPGKAEVSVTQEHLPTETGNLVSEYFPLHQEI